MEAAQLMASGSTVIVKQLSVEPGGKTGGTADRNFAQVMHSLARKGSGRSTKQASKPRRESTENIPIKDPAVQQGVPVHSDIPSLLAALTPLLPDQLQQSLQALLADTNCSIPGQGSSMDNTTVIPGQSPITSSTAGRSGTAQATALPGTGFTLTGQQAEQQAAALGSMPAALLAAGPVMENAAVIPGQSPITSSTASSSGTAQATDLAGAGFTLTGQQPGQQAAAPGSMLAALLAARPVSEAMGQLSATESATTTAKQTTTSTTPSDQLNVVINQLSGLLRQSEQTGAISPQLLTKLEDLLNQARGVTVTVGKNETTAEVDPTGFTQATGAASGAAKADHANSLTNSADPLNTVQTAQPESWGSQGGNSNSGDAGTHPTLTQSDSTSTRTTQSSSPDQLKPTTSAIQSSSEGTGSSIPLKQHGEVVATPLQPSSLQQVQLGSAQANGFSVPLLLAQHSPAAGGTAQVSVATGDKLGSSVINQIVDNAQLAVTNGTSSIRIQLKPEFLGELKLVVTVQQGVINAHFLAHNLLTAQMIETRLPELKQALSDQGLSCQHLSISLDSGQENNQGTSPQSQQYSDPFRNPGGDYDAGLAPEEAQMPRANQFNNGGMLNCII